MWWEQASADERAAVLAIPSVRDRLSAAGHALPHERPELSNGLREALLESLYASGANLLILPVQDVFGWRDRINRPATVGDDNWTWRLPWFSDRLSIQPQAMTVAGQLRAWSERHGRRV
jgi:4-alpha-glucanotransferase